MAELALLHILNCGRNFSQSIQEIKQGTWPGSFSGSELDGKTVGLLGFGNIAKHLARMLGGFQVNIIIYDPYLKDNVEIKTIGQKKLPLFIQLNSYSQKLRSSVSMFLLPPKHAEW